MGWLTKLYSKKVFFWKQQTKQNKTEQKKLAKLVSSSELDSFENKFQTNFFHLVPLPVIYFNCDKLFAIEHKKFVSTFKTTHIQWLVLHEVTPPPPPISMCNVYVSPRPLT